MQKEKLQIVSKVRLNRKLYLQEELDSKKFRSLVDEKMDETMENFGFKK